VDDRRALSHAHRVHAPALGLHDDQQAVARFAPQVLRHQVGLGHDLGELDSQLRLATILGIKPPSVTGWYDRVRVPAERCIAIETATGVSRHDLRPDVFGPALANDSGQEVDRAA